MKVKFLQPCRVALDLNGYVQVAVKKGDVMDLPDAHAQSLINSRNDKGIQDAAVAADDKDVVTVSNEPPKKPSVGKARNKGKVE